MNARRRVPPSQQPGPALEFVLELQQRLVCSLPAPPTLRLLVILLVGLLRLPVMGFGMPRGREIQAR